MGKTCRIYSRKGIDTRYKRGRQHKDRQRRKEAARDGWSTVRLPSQAEDWEAPSDTALIKSAVFYHKMFEVAEDLQREWCEREGWDYDKLCHQVKKSGYDTNGFERAFLDRWYALEKRAEQYTKDHFRRLYRRRRPQKFRC